MMVKKHDWKSEINELDWAYAKKKLAKQPDGVKLDRKETGLSTSFIKINGEIYAMSNKKFFDPLGEGSFGKVKMIENENGQRFALKIEGRGLRGEKDVETKIGKITGLIKGEAVRQLGEQKKFKGKNTKIKLYTAMELKEGKELAKEIYQTFPASNKINYAKRQNITQTQKLIIALKCCESIQKLHEKNIIHADIKPENFVVDVKGNQIVLAAIDRVGAEPDFFWLMMA